MSDDDPATTLHSFLHQAGRKRWTDEMRRQLVLQIQHDKGYRDLTEVTAADFGEHRGAFRVKRFGHSHREMVETLFPPTSAVPSGEGAPEAAAVVVVTPEDTKDPVRYGISKSDGMVDVAREVNSLAKRAKGGYSATDLDQPQWFWVVIANVVAFVVSKRVLSGLVQLLTHLNTWMPVYLALANLAVVHRRRKQQPRAHGAGERTAG